MPAVMPRTRHARRVTAIWLCLAWLLGFELGPDLHQAMHPRLAAHHHDGDRVDGPVIAVHVDGEVHHHGGVAHQHALSGGPVARPSPVGSSPDGSPTRDARLPGAHELVPAHPAPGHGAHSAAHRGLAIATAPPVVTAPLPVVRTLVPTAAPASGSRTDAPTPAAAARGPPLA